MFDLTGFQRDQLYVIAGLDGVRGVKVQEELEEYYLTDVQPGRLYPNLDVLVEKGLVEKEPINDRANSYSVTPQGRRMLAARNQWESRYVRQSDGDKRTVSPSTDD